MFLHFNYDFVSFDVASIIFEYWKNINTSTSKYKRKIIIIERNFNGVTHFNINQYLFIILH